MKDKISIILGAGIVIAVLVTLYFYVINVGNLELIEILLTGIVVILLASAMYIILDRLKNVKKGLPAQDERLKLTNYKACYYGFIASIWSAVGVPTITSIIFDYELPGHLVTAVVVLCGGLTFIISYLYLAWKGN